MSPIISNNPKDISYFHALLDTMQELGFYYNEQLENCSGQINIGVDYFNSPQAMLIFIETFCNAEEVLFHIANKEGQLLRQSVHTNSRFKAISGRIGTRTVSEDITWDEVLTMFTATDWHKEGDNQIKGLLHKKDSICLRDQNRFEIRIFNGSAEFEVWRENILLIGKMAEFANRCADILKQKKEITPEDENLLWLREELRDNDVTLEEKLYTLMDMIFLGDDKSKQIYVDRFYALEKKIEETKTDKYRTGYGDFSTVEFEEVYESQIEKTGGVISFDPNTGKYEVSKYNGR